MIDETKTSWSTDTIHEIIGDLACFEILLKIKNLVKDVETKIYLSQFLKMIAPLYAYEIANSLQNLGIVDKKDFFNPGMNKKIQSEREKAVKYIIVKSSQKEKATCEMGLNFNKKVYDMNLVLCNNKLMSMNYEDYIDKIDEKEIDFWNSLFDFPRRALNAFILAFNFDTSLDDLFVHFSEQLEEIASDIENKLVCNRYSYSSYTLFSLSKTLDTLDKIFVLYRYRMISSATNIEHVVPLVDIKIGDKIIVSFKKFFRKYKALVIDIVGKEIKNMDTEFSCAIKEAIQRKIDNNKFWKLNRTIRNNLHYVETKLLAKEDLAIVDHYQQIYLGIINDYILDNLNIHISKECIDMTNFLKACQEKGMTKSDIDKLYYYYYVKFKITGKI